MTSRAPSTPLLRCRSSRLKKANVLLVHPPVSLKHLYSQFASGGSELPPLGLCYLAARIRQSRYAVRILDCMAEKLSAEEAVRRMVRDAPDVIGISTYTPYITGTARFVGLIKEALPHVPVVIGGGHITAAPMETLRAYPQFDLGVVGEAEEVFVQLLDTLLEGGDLSAVPSLVYRDENGEVRMNPRGPFIQDLDSLPMPAWELLPDLRKYYIPAADTLNRFPAGSVICARGCPGKCTFCNLSIFGRQIRAHSSAYMIEMIKDQMRRFGIREVFFQDDTYLTVPKIVREVCEAILRENLDLTWSCYGRVDMAKPDLFKLMKKAGCWQISFGMETGAQEILDFSQKGIKLEKTEQAVRWATEAGIRVKGLFMIGNFYETPETIERTVKFIRKLKITDFHMTFFTPFPGSESYEMALTGKYGWFDPDWDKLDMWTPSFIPNDLTERELWRHYKRIYRSVYLQPRILFYYLTKLKHPRMFKKILGAACDFTRFMLSPLHRDEAHARSACLDMTGRELARKHSPDLPTPSFSGKSGAKATKSVAHVRGEGITPGR